jgi:hypothetical protein
MAATSPDSIKTRSTHTAAMAADRFFVSISPAMKSNEEEREVHGDW